MEQKTKKRFMYGAGATAMALVLVAGLSLTQLDDAAQRFNNAQQQQPASSSGNNFSSISTNITASKATIPVIGELFSSKQESAPSQEKKTEGSVVSDLEDVFTFSDETLDHAAPASVEAIEQKNEPLHRWRALQEERPTAQRAAKAKSHYGAPAARQEGADYEMDRAQSAMPAPIAGSAEQLGSAAKAKDYTDDDPLVRWRALQEERVQRGDISAAKKQQKLEKMEQKLAEIEQALKEENSNEDPLNRWRRLQEERIKREMEAAKVEEARDKFESFKPNPFKFVTAEPVSTFSSDVDTASYSFVRKTLNNGQLPHPSAVRVEEMVNYFNYNYPVPESRSEPFRPSVTVIDSPWAQGRKLMHIGIKGYQVAPKSLRSNLVFLLDVSGSMNASDKLPLVKNSMKMLLDSLHPDDTVSIVVYAGSTGVVLEPTKVSNEHKIISAMNNLRAGGGTAGAAGIELAYNMAEQNFDKGAVNRVILATDGDFNVGISNHNELKRYVERKRDKGIFLSVLGFGQGNYNDQMMQALAQNGNGVAAYIDNLSEARKVLVEEATSSLFPIAKDVKFQVEFNPELVSEYRLIGYETRALKREDFNNDKIDAGDIGAGHSVTAIYEFVPVGSASGTVDPLRYGKTEAQVKKKKPTITNESEYAYLKMRYKLPMESKSKLITRPVIVGDEEFNTSCPRYASCPSLGIPQDVAFASAVAAFGQILKGGEHTGDFSYDNVIALAQLGKGADPYGYRTEFIRMVRLAKTLAR